MLEAGPGIRCGAEPEVDAPGGGEADARGGGDAYPSGATGAPDGATCGAEDDAGCAAACGAVGDAACGAEEDAAGGMVRARLVAMKYWPRLGAAGTLCKVKSVGKSMVTLRSTTGCWWVAGVGDAAVLLSADEMAGLGPVPRAVPRSRSGP